MENKKETPRQEAQRIREEAEREDPTKRRRLTRSEFGMTAGMLLIIIIIGFIGFWLAPLWAKFLIFFYIFFPARGRR